MRPNFLIVGAAKSGTTALYKYLDRHSDVFFPEEKEPHYFVPQEVKQQLHFSVRSFQEYKELFLDAGNHSAVGEASVLYMPLHNTSIPLIKEKLGDIKIIIVLRNPVERAISAYKHSVRFNADEELPFEEAFHMNDKRKSDGSHPMLCYHWLSSYSEQVKGFQDSFRNVHIVFSEELKSKPKETLQAVCAFLSITNFEEVEPLSANGAGFMWKSKAIGKYLNKLLNGKVRRWLRESFPWLYKRIKQVSLAVFAKNEQGARPEVSSEINNTMFQEVIKLENLLNKKINCWRATYDK